MCKMEKHNKNVPYSITFAQVFPVPNTDIIKMNLQPENTHKILNVHDAIKPLYNLSKSFSLWSYRYEQENKIRNLNKTEKIIAGAFVIFFIIYICWSLYVRNTTFLKNQPTVSSIIDGIFNIYLHILAVSSIIFANSSTGNLTKTFYLNIDHIVKHSPLYQNCIFDDIRKNILNDIIVTFSLGIIIASVQILLAFATNYMMVLIYFSTYVAEIILFLTLLQITCKVEILKKYFDVLNYRLRVLNQNMNSELKIQTRKTEYVQGICKIHQKLCSLIDDTNQCHGWQIVILSATIISLSINSLYYGVVNGLPSDNASKEFMNVEIAFTGQAIFNVLFHSGLLIYLSIKCSSARNSALITGSIANEMLLNISSNASDKNEMAYKEQLQFLIQHIMYKNPHFSAAGIFCVDTSMISLIISAVATYFIVILQFRQPKAI